MIVEPEPKHFPYSNEKENDVPDDLSPILAQAAQKITTIHNIFDGSEYTAEKAEMLREALKDVFTPDATGLEFPHYIGSNIRDDIPGLFKDMMDDTKRVEQPAQYTIDTCCDYYSGYYATRRTKVESLEYIPLSDTEMDCITRQTTFGHLVTFHIRCSARREDGGKIYRRQVHKLSVAAMERIQEYFALFDGTKASPTKQEAYHAFQRMVAPDATGLVVCVSHLPEQEHLGGSNATKQDARVEMGFQEMYEKVTVKCVEAGSRCTLTELLLLDNGVIRYTVREEFPDSNKVVTHQCRCETRDGQVTRFDVQSFKVATQSVEEDEEQGVDKLMKPRQPAESLS